MSRAYAQTHTPRRHAPAFAGRMSSTRPAPPARRRRRTTTVAALLVVAAAVGVTARQSLPDSWSATLLPGAGTSASPSGLFSGEPRDRSGMPLLDDGELDVDAGDLPPGVTADDRGYPAVARLDPALRDALSRATRAAADDGIRLHVNSGWRSAAYQERLLAEAVDEHGSVEEAARWVATATTSPHVSGDAVDVGPTDAMYWLGQHGATYGLCQVYGNEPWHFELRPAAVEEGCPEMYDDPTEDPRMQE